MDEPTTDFEALGGEPVLRAIIDDFVERIFSDMMIGFFFAQANKARVKAKEYEHAAAWLGADVRYSGKPLREAHAKHPIMGGQFSRRRKILHDTLRDHGVDEALIARWLAHQDSLRAQITGDLDGQCTSSPAAPAPSPRNGDDT